jgi:transcriptional regulator with XRE-family HTH domain
MQKFCPECHNAAGALEAKIARLECLHMRAVPDVLEKIEPVYAAIGQRVLSERMRAGWTQQDLACQAGLSRTSIANVELGRQRLMLHQIVMLADVFSISVGELVGLTIDTRGTDEVKSLRRDLGEARRRIAKLEAMIGSIGERCSSALSE